MQYLGQINPIKIGRYNIYLICNSESNEDIMYAEAVASSVTHLKNEKAAGIDGLIPKIFKYFPKLFPLFYRVIEPCILKRTLSWGIIMLYNNYTRKVACMNQTSINRYPLSVCSKLFSFLLNRRLSYWVEDNNTRRKQDLEKTSRPHFYSVCYVSTPYTHHKDIVPCIHRLL